MEAYPFKPLIHEEARVFWEGCNKQKLVFEKCTSCGHIRWPASIICPKCHSMEYTHIESSGRGVVYSYIVFRRAFHPSVKENLPYVVASITLEEGVTLISNIINCEIETVYTGMPVKVIWQQLDDQTTLPIFEPITK